VCDACGEHPPAFSVDMITLCDCSDRTPPFRLCARCEEIVRDGNGVCSWCPVPILYVNSIALPEVA